MVYTIGATKRALGQHDPRRARARLVLALAVGFLVWWFVPGRFGNAFKVVAGWDAAALSMGALAWMLIFRADAQRTRGHAAEDDPGRRAVWIIAILASGFSLFATAVVLRGARMCAAEARTPFVVLCLLAVASAWALTHTAYTLRYAHLYYRDDGNGEGGLTFPNEPHVRGEPPPPDEPPAYIDFAYFAFTIGMCFQVSDVTITSRLIRRAVTAHAILSFTYNTAILATAVSLIVGFFG
jgi:uncharacterized membrane protein